MTAGRRIEGWGTTLKQGTKVRGSRLAVSTVFLAAAMMFSLCLTWCTAVSAASATSDHRTVSRGHAHNKHPRHHRNKQHRRHRKHARKKASRLAATAASEAQSVDPQSLSRQGIEPYSKHPSETRPYEACPPATKTRATCDLIVVPPGYKEPIDGPVAQSGPGGGLTPEDLQSLYNIAKESGSGQTIAIIGPWDKPNAESDLAKFREHYGLPKCTTANGCFKKINQKGELGNYPPTAFGGWGLEGSLDLAMASAACPKCKLLLVEAECDCGPNYAVFRAVPTAITWGATVVSMSYGFKETASTVSENQYFGYPGVPVLVASHDTADVYYPAASPDVIAVGGTGLSGGQEYAWKGAGSGCSKYHSKPSWQKDTGCDHRAVADVSAVADPSSATVSFYSTEEGSGGWKAAGGTSASAPIVAGIEATKSKAFREAGAKAFYEAGENHELYDPVYGGNKNCTSHLFQGDYLCEAVAGYDGPTGMGTLATPLPGPPASTEAATLLEPEEATLNGSVNPQGSSTTYVFEYGTTTAYGSAVPAAPASAGSGTQPIRVVRKVTGLKPSTKYYYRLSATNSTGTFKSPDFGTESSSFTTPAAPQLAVATEPASNVQIGAATLKGAINPGGVETTHQFEYGTTESYGSSVPVPAKSTGTQFATVSQGITGLKSGKTYHFRLKATQGSTTKYGGDRTFTTPLGGPPVAVTEPASNLDGIGATLNGTVHPGGESTSYKFEYGTTTAYGKAAPAGFKSIGSGIDDVKVSEKIVGLEPGTTYHFRVVAQSAKGTVEGTDKTFTTPDWTVQPVSQLKGSASYLHATSCTLSTACVAVGYREEGTFNEEKSEYEYKDVTLAALRSSPTGGWQDQTTPNPAGAKGSRLEDVSCASSTVCTAVGYYVNSSGTTLTLVERWNGTEWTIQATPNPSGAKESRLEGVSCTAVSACTAVGYYVNSSGTPLTLVERWNGTEWTIQSSANPSGAEKALLHDVSCVTGSDCFAVGESKEAGKEPTSLAERWNGSAWSIQTMSQPTKSLTGLSCSSSTWCMAVGDALKVERWNGSSWSRLEAPSPGPAARLKGVFCKASNACTAVGDYSHEGTVPLGEHWDGNEWSLQSATDPVEGPGTEISTLEGISCESASGCTAVGYYDPPQQNIKELVEVHLGGKAPSATTEAATNLTPETATLNASVNPNGEDTTYQLEYGTTTSYGTSVPVPAKSIGTGAKALKVSQAIGGLAAKTTYHFRVVAVNAVGTAYGADETFTTKEFLENITRPVVSPPFPYHEAPPLSTTTGTWTESPTSYTYQWRRCKVGGWECTDISGATSSTYTPVTADVNYSLVVKVTAKNSTKQNSAFSKATKKVRSTQLTEYSLPTGSEPFDVTAGPDGNMWFVNRGKSKVGKITTSGTITEYSLPTSPAPSWPAAITAGPDGKLWFVNSGTDKVGKITTSGTITEYSLPAGSDPTDIDALGSDLWFTNSTTKKIGKITTSGTITEYAVGVPPHSITAGPDGNVWFASLSKIGKITTSGTLLAEYSLPGESDTNDITAGPDGNLWFVNWGTDKIGKITTSGTITEYSLPAGSGPTGIVSGPGEYLWFVNRNSSEFGLITTSGTPIAEYWLPAGSEPWKIAKGPNDTLWFVNANHKIGKIGISVAAPENFIAEEAPATIAGKKAGSLKAVFATPYTGFISCGEHDLGGELAAGFGKNIALTASYGECVTLGGTVSASLSMGGCSYVQYLTGKIDIVGASCASNPITMTASGCTVTIGPQSGLSGLTYSNALSEGSAAVKQAGEAPGLKYTITSPTCFGAGSGTFTDGSYNASDLFTATNAGGKAQGLWME
jgi:streptogramin lyase